MKFLDTNERQIADHSIGSGQALRPQLENIAVENAPDEQTIRQLFQDYLRMYASRDDLLCVAPIRHPYVSSRIYGIAETKTSRSVGADNRAGGTPSAAAGKSEGNEH